MEYAVFRHGTGTVLLSLTFREARMLRDAIEAIELDSAEARQVAAMVTEDLTRAIIEGGR